MRSQTTTTSASVAKISRQTDDRLADRVEQWLNTHVPLCAGARITGLHSSEGSGLSGDTHIVTLADERNPGTGKKVVLKKDVVENQTNPQSDFAKLIHVQSVLGNIPDLGVPQVLGVEYSSDILGAPFLVMKFVEGEIPADVPSYAQSGFVRDATAGERAKMWQSGVDFLVRLHGINWAEHGLESLRFDFPGETEVHRCVNHAIAMYEQESAGERSAICDQAIEWLVDKSPADPPESICWGDARIGNMIWRNFECVAVVDWEMCSLGSPGIDLGWWSFFHRWSTFGQGNPQLDGMCVGQALAGLYHERGGIRINDFRYYEVLAAVRGLSIWLRQFKALRAAGVIGEGVDPLGDSIHMVKVLRALMDETEGEA